MSGSEHTASPIVVHNWHLVLTIICWLVLCTMAFTTLRAQSDENERRIQQLELRPNVTLQQYQDGQHNIEQRLERIEKKIDDVETRRRP